MSQRFTATHIAKAARAIASTKALSKSVSVPTHGRQDIAANLKIKNDRKKTASP
jgi:hypothetical protein